MGKATKIKKEKVRKLTEEEYTRYVMSLRGELPTEGVLRGGSIAAVKENLKRDCDEDRI